jgi:hypothetical protein
MKNRHRVSRVVSIDPKIDREVLTLDEAELLKFIGEYHPTWRVA